RLRPRARWRPREGAGARGLPRPLRRLRAELLPLLETLVSADRRARRRLEGNVLAPQEHGRGECAGEGRREERPEGVLVPRGERSGGEVARPGEGCEDRRGDGDADGASDLLSRVDQAGREPRLLG